MTTYFWSGSNRPGEIRALAKHRKPIGVAVQKLGAGLGELESLGRRIVLDVTRARGGQPILMFNRERAHFAALPVGDVPVAVGGRSYLLGFRKCAVNVARSESGNELGSLLRRLMGEDAGARGTGHKVALELTRVGWRMGPAELDRAALAGARVFVDSGAFSEFKTGKPIGEQGWALRLAAYRRIASALGSRCYLVTPDKVGDQGATLHRLRQHAHRVRELRALGAHLIVPIQRGPMSPPDFDRACSAILGFDDYIRGIPSQAAAASVAEIGELSGSLPPGARVHLLGLGSMGRRYQRVLAALGRPVHLVSCDSARIPALVGRTNGPRGGPRPLTVCTDEAKRALGLPLDRPAPRGPLGELVKFRALDAYLRRAS